MLRIREVEPADCALLFAWANDPDVRRHCLCPEPIPWDTHVAWFERKRHDENSLLFLALDEASVPVGQIRFDLAGQDAEIGISLDRARRGQGYAVPLIELGVQTLFQRTDVRTAHAWIKPDNLASRKSFARAGFHDQGCQIRAGLRLHHFTRVCCNYP